MTGFQRWFTNLSTLIVGVSGVVYAWMKYLMTSHDPYSVVNHPLQPWMLDLHVLAAPLLVFAVGMIARDHIIAKLKSNGSRPGRGTGLFAVVCLLPMIATGYLVQVFTGDTPRLVCVVVHLATGAIYLAAFAGHVTVSWRAAARKAGRSNGRTPSSPVVDVDGAVERTS